MKKSINVLFFNFTDESTFRDQILSKVEQDYEVNVVNTSSAKVVTNFLNKTPKTIFVFNAESTTEYMRARTILSNFKENKKKALYSIGVLSNVNEEISASLKALGCRKIFDRNAKPLDVAKIIHQSNQENQPTAKTFDLPKSVLAVNVESRPGTSVNCLLDSFEENNLLVEIDGINDYLPGDRIKLNVIFEYESCKIDLQLDAVVGYIEETDLPQISMLNVNLSDDESISLENFMILYDKKQQKINEFMLLAKGA